MLTVPAALFAMAGVLVDAGADDPVARAGTGWALADLARHLQALGARYVIKPLAARDLLDLVNTSLKKGAAYDSPADSDRR